MNKVKESILRLALKRKEEGAILISRHGRPLRWLLDLRPVFLQKEALEQIVAAFWERHGAAGRFQLAGMETAAIPLLTGLLLGAPLSRGPVNGFIIRKERKTTGLGNAIEGAITAEPVILVDDVINSGSSAEKARVVIEMHGGKVQELFVVVDYRSKKALRWRARHSIEVNSLFTLEDFDLELKQDEPPPAQAYRPLWQAEVQGAYPYYVVPKSAPLLAGGRIYRGCDAARMQALDAATGALIWEYQVTGAAPRKGIWSSPAVHDGRIYFGAYNGSVYCLDAANGGELWIQGYGEWVGASPLVVPQHGLVYFGIEYERPWARGSIAALDIHTGDKVWEYPIAKYQHGSPCYFRAADLIIWGTADHEMVALDALTGKVAWTFRTRRSVKYAPVVDEERRLVAFASFDKSIYLLDATTGALRGEWETGEICYTTPLFVGNRLFCGSGDRYLYVIDVERLQLVEKLGLGARVYASPRLSGKRVIVGTTGGKIFEIDVDTLRVEGALQVPDAVTNAVEISPDGTRLYVSTYMNYLYAFERVGIAATIEPAPKECFLRISAHHDVQQIQQEILTQPELWSADTARQRKITVQRETESIFLRGALRSGDATGSTDDIQESETTRFAEHFPATLRWVENIAAQRGQQLGRALLAKLPPGGRVYPHVDRGAYYAARDRFHLVIFSAGSRMTCGNEQAIMQEGELWWFDNKQPHAALNPSAQPRIHLIFDLSRITT
jgi:outer membrane protein assembly factor BamB/orotate phosphoribosyltransferase